METFVTVGLALVTAPVLSSACFLGWRDCRNSGLVCWVAGAGGRGSLGQASTEYSRCKGGEPRRSAKLWLMPTLNFLPAAGMAGQQGAVEFDFETEARCRLARLGFYAGSGGVSGGGGSGGCLLHQFSSVR